MARPGVAGTPATRALAAAGVEHTVHAYAHDRRAVASGLAYGEEAAVALGVDPARVLKTLVVSVDTGADRDLLAVAVVPVARRLDLKAAASALGGRRALLADAAAAQRSTGYVLGGISPLGQRRRLPTVVDASAMGHASVLVSGGRRGLDVELSPHDLVALTDATVATVSAAAAR